MHRLKNKTAIVTGAAHGIGRAIAECFVKEGASVFVFDIEKKVGAASAKEIGATFIACDVSSATAVVRAIKKVGRVDVLCNNAAYIGQWHNAGEATDKEWDACYRVSLMGTEYCTRAVLPQMVKRKSGSIINISSIQGLVGGRNSAAYTTIKHALIGLTRSVAYDYGAHNIRCNAICPGAIRTRISPAPGSELHQRQISKTFLGRVGEPHEVGAAAVFLASDEASYVTGAVLAVDGGWTAM
ncbi:MAG: short-chain dehydrogenase/reductase [Verrucomicrobiales bacterium]|nr:short-chain dehydrogenase/reductase [Verrucomicrobiales bacterium]